jgi:hypothetical protein
MKTTIVIALLLLAATAWATITLNKGPSSKLYKGPASKLYIGAPATIEYATWQGQQITWQGESASW